MADQAALYAQLLGGIDPRALQMASMQDVANGPMADQYRSEMDPRQKQQMALMRQLMGGVQISPEAQIGMQSYGADQPFNALFQYGQPEMTDMQYRQGNIDRFVGLDPSQMQRMQQMAQQMPQQVQGGGMQSMRDQSTAYQSPMPSPVAQQYTQQAQPQQGQWSQQQRQQWQGAQQQQQQQQQQQPHWGDPWKHPAFKNYQYHPQVKAGLDYLHSTMNRVGQGWQKPQRRQATSPSPQGYGTTTG